MLKVISCGIIHFSSKVTKSRPGICNIQVDRSQRYEEQQNGLTLWMWLKTQEVYIHEKLL